MVRFFTGLWKEVGDVLPRYTITDIQAMSKITHGICNECYDQIEGRQP